jgi:hypothetical protein
LLYYFLQHLAQPAASVQHLAQVAWSLQQLPSQAAFFSQQVEQPVVISIPATATMAKVIIVFIWLVCLFRGWLITHPQKRAGLGAT